MVNESTGQYLQNARVRVLGTNLEALSQVDGSFRLSGVPVGDQQVAVSYTGLDGQTLTVKVVADQVARADFHLQSEIYRLGAFVVAGEREGQSKAINDQRASDSMKSIVASDAFGDLTDNNAAELLKSLPGIALTYSGEDAAQFVMRGQSSVYASVTSDNNPMASAARGGLDGRGVNMLNVDVANIETIEVNRAPTAAQPANTMGGSVNLVTKSAFSQKGRRVRVTAGMNLNTEAKGLFRRSYQGFGERASPNMPAFEFDFSDTFRGATDHPLGLTLSAQLGGRYRYNTQYTAGYTYVPGLATGQTVTAATPTVVSNVKFNEASAGWRREALSAGVDYKLTENAQLYFRGTYNGSVRLFGINHFVQPITGLQTSGAGTAMVALNGNTANHVDSRPNATPVGGASSTGSRIAKGTGYEAGLSRTYQYTAGFKEQRGDLRLEGSMFYGKSFDNRQTVPGTSSLTYDVLNVGFTMDNIQSDAAATLQQTAGPDYRKVANYGRVVMTGQAVTSLDQQWGGRLDAKRAFNQIKFPVLLQAGAALNTQDRQIEGYWTNPRLLVGAGPDGAFGNSDDVAVPLGQFVNTNMPGRWNMRGYAVDPGEFIDGAKLWAYIKAHPEAATRDLVADVTGEKAAKRFREQIAASYLMATIRLGPVSVVPGVRWERTDDRGFGWGRNTKTTPAGLTLAQQADFVRAQYFPVTRERSYDGYFPNFQANYRAKDNLILRAAYTKTIGRPNLGNLLPNDTVYPSSAYITRSNPDLKPFTARNYDLSVEYYFTKSAGKLTAGVFRKEITDYFGTTTVAVPSGADNGYNGDYAGYTVSTSSNIAGKTTTEGFELDYQQALRFLPGFLRNLAASGSYTKVKATPAPGATMVTGIFPDVFNAGLAYNDGRFRLDLKYNLRKSWLNSFTESTRARTFVRDNDRWDLAVNYRFHRRYLVYFDWRNFLNERDRQVTEERVTYYMQAGTSISAGLRIDL